MEKKPKIQKFKKITSVPFINNPRKITDRGLGELKDSLLKLGDLSGIVINLETGERIGGNQMSKIFNINDCELEITKEFKDPDNQGTVRFGHVIWKDHSYSYREVRWDKETASIANLAANKMGGVFDEDAMRGISRDLLKKSGFNEVEIENIKKIDISKINNVVAEYPIVPKMSERYNYVMIVAENEIDLAYLETFFKLRRQKSYKNDNIGIGRVVSFEDFKKLVDGIN